MGIEARVQLQRNDALLLVDVQNDFLPGGCLPVGAASGLIAALNNCLDVFETAALPVYVSRDWHPPDHVSFHAQGGPWPAHCVAGTSGAGFPAALCLPAHAIVVSRAQQRDREAYSAFAGTDLAQQLRRTGRRRLVVGGIGTEGCVLRTVLDARWLGFAVVLLHDAIVAADLRPGDGERAIAQMRAAGTVLAESASMSAADVPAMPSASATSPDPGAHGSNAEVG